MLSILTEKVFEKWIKVFDYMDKSNEWLELSLGRIIYLTQETRNETYQGCFLLLNGGGDGYVFRK